MDKHSGWMVPLIQSATTGALVTVPMLVLMVYYRVHLVDAFVWSTVTFCVITWCMWMYLWWAWFCVTMERITGHDINGDGVIGDPQIGAEIIHPVRVDVTQGNMTHWARFDNAKKLADVAEAIVAGRPFAQRELSDILSRNEFNRMADELLARDLISWRDEEHPQQGYLLTDTGRAMMADVANRPEGFY